MKTEKPKTKKKEVSETVTKQAKTDSAELKKKKKAEKVDEALEAPKTKKKETSGKGGKKAAEPKEQKAPKEDKVTKFLVSMKKSVRKNVKKEAADAGVSMNEYIVAAVEEKLKLSFKS